MAGQARDRPVSSLRGAPARGNPRRAAAVLAVVVLASLLATAGILFAAGAHKNAQISDLRDHGVRVPVTVTRCLGLLGGSGSNAAGYSCRGTYRFEGRRYDEALPGTRLRAPGATMVAIVARDDPALLTDAAVLASERPSWRVFIAPAVLAVAGVLLASLLVVRFRRWSGPRGGGLSQVGGV